MTKSYAVIVGARPNFVKAASFLAGAKSYPDRSFTLIHTGQHYDNSLSQVFFDEMNIPKPDIQLTLPAEWSEQMGLMINTLTKEFTSHERSYDGVVVFGDVKSSLAGALAATRARLPLIHIEAGLRSNDRRMPEETNRVSIDHLSDSLMISEESGREHLVREGVTAPIHPVGSLMIESLERFRNKAPEHSLRGALGIHGDYVVATIHRAENLASPEILETILRTLARLAKRWTVVFPMHPGTRARVKELGLESYLKECVVTEPLGYLPFLDLMLHAKGCVTDSGGIQEELSHLGIPCCTFRDNTERPVTVELGSNRLFAPATLDDFVTEIEGHLVRTDFIPGSIPLWDGEVSKRILDCML